MRGVLLQKGPSEWKSPATADSVFRDALDACMQPQTRNLQSKLFLRIPLEKFDFIGITECFDEDLAQISARLSLNLQPLRANASEKPRALTPEEITALRAYHSEDVALYNRALAMR